MTVRFVPIPKEHVQGSLPVWFPFVESIAKHSGYSNEQLTDRIISGEVQPILFWDDEERRGLAFAGVRVYARGSDSIAEVIWMTGENMDAWTHLIGEFEAYARERLKCAGVRMFARRGWKPFLTKAGYSETHVIMDKELHPQLRTK